MTIEIPTEAELRGNAALRQLIEAVVAAEEHDEADWVEWKGPLDVSTKEGCFHIARAVLGMANRDPERAAQTCGGVGHVIVGAEPGALHGLTTVDPARLDQLMELYLGSDGPAWTASYIGVDGKNVLVVTVEAPKPGDRIHVLRREFDAYLSGCIFIRRSGRTVRADAAELDMLQRRLVATPASKGANIGVRIVGALPLTWFDPATVQPTVDRWVQAQASQHLENARRVIRKREKERTTRQATPMPGTLGALGAIAEQQRALLGGRDALGVLQRPDERSIAEYEAELTKWASTLEQVAKNGLPGRYAAAGHGVIRVEVENLGSRFLPDVEVVVHFDLETVKGFHEKPRWIEYPTAPHEFGKPRTRSEVGWLSRPAVPPISTPPTVGPFRRTWVEDGSVKVRWAVGDLRQHATNQSEAVYVFLRERPADGVLRGTWKATVPDVDGILSGAVEVPVADEPVDLTAVLDTQRPKKA